MMRCTIVRLQHEFWETWSTSSVSKLYAVLFKASQYLLTNATRWVKLQLPHLNVFTVQLLGKDDPSQEDPEIYIDRWRSYITSYTSVSNLLGTAAPTTHQLFTTGNSYKGLDRTEEQVSVPSKVRLPYLRSYGVLLHVCTNRNRGIIPDHPAPAVVADNALEMKICVRTYHIFYVSNTADFFYKPSPPLLTGIPRRPKGAWFEKLKAES